MTSRVVLILDDLGNEIYVPVIMVDAELDTTVDAEVDIEFDATEEVLPSA